jgi:hypothetical protein
MRFGEGLSSSDHLSRHATFSNISTICSVAHNSAMSAF